MHSMFLSYLQGGGGGGGLYNEKKTLMRDSNVKQCALGSLLMC